MSDLMEMLCAVKTHRLQDAFAKPHNWTPAQRKKQEGQNEMELAYLKVMERGNPSLSQHHNKQ